MSGLSDLYPFLGTSAPDPQRLESEARRSTLQKAADITALRRMVWQRHSDEIIAGARLLASAYHAGKKVLAFGNGGSATDARDLVCDLLAVRVGAVDLTSDYAMITAVANDVGVNKIFSRQVIAYGKAGDVAVGFSTSGESCNVIEALVQARGLGLSTIGFAGGEGGAMSKPGFLDVAITVPSPHNTRVQEAQATTYHTMLTMMRALLAGEAE